MAHVFFPTQLRGLAAGAHEADVPGATLRELVNNLSDRFPGMRERLIDSADADRLIAGLAAVIDGEPADMGLLTKLEPDVEVHFLPAIAGGSADEAPAPRDSTREPLR